MRCPNAPDGMSEVSSDSEAMLLVPSPSRAIREAMYISSLDSSGETKTATAWGPMLGDSLFESLGDAAVRTAVGGLRVRDTVACQRRKQTLATEEQVVGKPTGETKVITRPTGRLDEVAIAAEALDLDVAANRAQRAVRFRLFHLQTCPTRERILDRQGAGGARVDAVAARDAAGRNQRIFHRRSHLGLEPAVDQAQRADRQNALAGADASGAHDALVRVVDEGYGWLSSILCLRT